MTRPKRSTKYRNYAKLDTYGFTSSDNDVLDLTDPNSAEFDNESVEKSVKDDIEKLIEQSIVRDERTLIELLGSRSRVEFDNGKSVVKESVTENVSEQAFEKDLRSVYEQQEARPKTKSGALNEDSSAPDLENLPKATSTSKKSRKDGKGRKSVISPIQKKKKQKSKCYPIRKMLRKKVK